MNPVHWRKLWDPTMSVAGDRMSVASVSIYPHFGTGFLEICLVLSWQALPEKTGIPKLVSLAYCFWLKFVSSSGRTKNSTIGGLISYFGRRSRNRWATASLSPVLIHFLVPHSKLSQRLLMREQWPGSLPHLILASDIQVPPKPHLVSLL
jgi:hypothetical protein